MNNINITRDEFLDYETVRKSGIYNMFDPQARDLSGLSKDKYITIIRNYSELKEQYGNM